LFPNFCLGFMGSNFCFGHDEDLSSRLKNFSLSNRESLLVDIAQNDIKISDEECQNSLFGKVIGDRIASWNGVTRTMSQIWRLRQPMEVKELGTNYFQFIFQCKEDKDRVAKGINWSIDNQYLLLTEWKTGLSPSHPIFQELPIWVQVFNVPLNWISSEVGLKIGKIFPRVNNVVVVGAGSHGGKILRLLVSVNLNESLPRCANIRLGDQIVSVSFKYEKLINMCHYCGLVGHLDRSCSERIDAIKNNSLKEGQFGEWMRAPDGPLWSGPAFSGSKFTCPDSPNNPTSQSPLKTTTSQMEENNQLLVISMESSQQEQPEVQGPIHPSPVSKEPTVSSSPNSLELISSEKAASTVHHIVVKDKSSLMEVEDSQAIISVVPLSSDLKMDATPMLHLKTWKRSNTADAFFFLSETKKSSSFVHSVVSKLGFNNRFTLVNPQGISGGLLLLWSSDISILNVSCQDFFIAVEFSFKNSVSSWGVFTYLSPYSTIRTEQWKFLESEKSNWGNRWFAIGDWNDICLSSDKLGGIPRSPRSMAGFNDFINNMAMEEIRMVGNKFTWCNLRLSEGLIQEKLDRGFCSLDWMQSFPNATITTILRSASDHSLLLLNSGALKEQNSKRFHFDKRWLLKEDISQVVSEAWSLPCTGTPFFKLKEKIKSTRKALIIWSSKLCVKKIMLQMGFCQQFVNLIMVCISSCSYSFKVNGLISGYVLPSRGIRQGDPLSPYLFIIMAELLSALVSASVASGDFIGLKLSRNGPALSHLLFADDSLFFCKASVDQTALLLNLLEKYRLFTGQTVNMLKSAVFFSRSCPAILQSRICSSLNGIPSHKSTRYLGLPLGIGKSKIEVFQYVVDSVKSRIQNWKSNMLTPAGKEVLIKAV
ncbi:Uncharacterized mitochondrial protein AtMg01250, partial [Striga hermonthica]